MVATPIGNLEDITLRAVRILQEVDFIAAEDTRLSRRLLQHHDIDTPLTSYHDFSRPGVVARLVGRLQSGERGGLISDAGMPGISDPGYRLVAAVLDAGLTVTPIPGPSAHTAALVASGLPTDRFVFEGFLPRKKGRAGRFTRLTQNSATTVFYESPHRLLDALERLATLAPQRRLVIARELTKAHEEFQRGTVTELLEAQQNRSPRGEYVLLLEGHALFEKRNRQVDAAGD
ncbi:MAG: 16S rRNA (cytidine(1402)-2'-O)-methyltransferase [Candidatus Delongbacteria bacterium]|nr:16S rRNA (cytidine(1402)-2'-O)-methyltransferase [Candidatus Delongbacteria bacterium]